MGGEAIEARKVKVKRRAHWVKVVVLALPVAYAFSAYLVNGLQWLVEVWPSAMRSYLVTVLAVLWPAAVYGGALGLLLVGWSGRLAWGLVAAGGGALVLGLGLPWLLGPLVLPLGLSNGSARELLLSAYVLFLALHELVRQPGRHDERPDAQTYKQRP